MKVTSKSYFNNVMMSTKYAHRGIYSGQNISPQYSWEGYPGDAKSFVLVMVDRHPKAQNWVHWVLADIPGKINSIPEGASHSSTMPDGIRELINTFGQMGYGGPEPPKGTGKHLYETTVYALDTENSGLKGKMTEDKILEKIGEHVVAQAQMIGHFVN